MARLARPRHAARAHGIHRRADRRCCLPAVRHLGAGTGRRLAHLPPGCLAGHYPSRQLTRATAGCREDQTEGSARVLLAGVVHHLRHDPGGRGHRAEQAQGSGRDRRCGAAAALRPARPPTAAGASFNQGLVACWQPAALSGQGQTSHDGRAGRPISTLAGKYGISSGPSRPHHGQHPQPYAHFGPRPGAVAPVSPSRVLPPVGPPRRGHRSHQGQPVQPARLPTGRSPAHRRRRPRRPRLHLLPS